MSGFAGLVRPESIAENNDFDAQALARMAEAIRFRGPDGSFQRQLACAGFAFSFLKTGPAPQEDVQPVSLDNNHWFLGDVRCDGRAEMTEKLRQSGVALAEGQSSERLVLEYVAAYGADSLPELIGDFSFTLWNEQRRELIAFRDLTGHRPFFYTFREGALVFSNTMQALLAVPGFTAALDEVFLGDFLLGSPYQELDRTVYRDIRRLPAGCMLEFSRRGFSVRRIAQMPIEEPLQFRRAEEYVEEFRRLFTQAVRDQLPLCDTTILLSGGLDSTSIAACAAALRRSANRGSIGALRAFSVDSRPLYEDDETILAGRLAKTLGIPCEIVHSGDVAPFRCGESREAGEFLLPEPALDPYAALYGAYFRQIARNSTVCLSGGGGDELLRLQGLPYLRYLSNSLGLPAAAATVIRYIAKYRKLPSLGTGIRARFRGVLRRSREADPYPPWLDADFARDTKLQERWQRIQSPAASEHPSNPVAFNSVNDGTVAMILETYDSTWTGCALEVRSPFLDRRLSRFLLRVPAIPWAADKQLLRRSQAGALPDEILLRKKSPLQGDDVRLHIASGTWNPSDFPLPPASLRPIVNWKAVAQQLRNTPADQLYLHLRPVALAHWLKSIENGSSIQ